MAGRGSGPSSHGATPASGKTASHRQAGKRQVLTLSRRHPHTTLVFRLARGGLVRFFVQDLGCGTVQSFTVRGHAGVNRVRFSARVGGRRLRAGSYRIRGRSRGKTVFQSRLVVAGRRASCTRGEAGPVLAELGSADVTGLTAGAQAKSSQPHASLTAAPVVKAKKRHSSHAGVLGARIVKILPGSPGTQLALLIVLAVAIFLLALGALPRQFVPHPAAAAFLARRRALIALAGLTALAAFLVSYFVG